MRIKIGGKDGSNRFASKRQCVILVLVGIVAYSGIRFFLNAEQVKNIQQVSSGLDLLTVKQVAQTAKKGSTRSTTSKASWTTISSSGSKFVPQQCSEDDLNIISMQLPEQVCKATSRIPWHNKCHFSWVTRCPEATWVSDFYRKLSHDASQQLQRRRGQPSQRTAVYVGCNKGMDAINTLRMLSNNPSVDKFTWRDAFFDNQKIAAGHCNQEYEPQYALDTKAGLIDTVVYCLEAMPVTANHLAETARKLHLDDRLLVKNMAASDTDGWTYFPNQADGKVGVEGMGLDSCSDPKKAAANPHSCANVTIATLDTLLLSSYSTKSNRKVDFLSIDVEGYDFNVLLGAKQVLPNVRYLEFEYNWKGPWGKQPLSGAMEYLESFGFVCYWAGNKGRVWRITKCWRDLYNQHFWSNVACVNANDPEVEGMANQLEEMFQATLRRGPDLAWEIDQEFREFYPIVKSGFVNTSEGLRFVEE